MTVRHPAAFSLRAARKIPQTLLVTIPGAASVPDARKAPAPPLFRSCAAAAGGISTAITRFDLRIACTVAGRPKYTPPASGARAIELKGSLQGKFDSKNPTTKNPSTSVIAARPRFHVRTATGFRKTPCFTLEIRTALALELAQRPFLCIRTSTAPHGQVLTIKFPLYVCRRNRAGRPAVASSSGGEAKSNPREPSRATNRTQLLHLS